MHEQPLQDWLTLTFLPGLGCTRIHRLLLEFETPAAVLSARPEQLGQVAGVSGKLVRHLKDPGVMDAARHRADLELQRLPGHELQLLSLDDPQYPAWLKTIEDPPLLLYCRGDITLLKHQSVALVGSRAATSYGRRVSRELARDLSGRSICVVSGMALGIDGEAHAGGLSGPGSTIGVLGCGIDIVYPRQHESLFREVGDKGLLVSEYPLGSPPEGFRFPERNRIISGLAAGVVVVEASLKSGSLITARLALEQGREVFAVPGRIDSVKSEGPHRLLQQGAKLVHVVDDIIDELRLAGSTGDFSAAVENPEPPAVSNDEQVLLDLLEVYPVSIDELVRHSGRPAGDVFDLLLRLELKGMVRQLPGQQYERRDTDGKV